jgi:hypothetical protein
VTHPALSGVVTFDLEITATIDQDAPALGTQGVFRVDVYAGAFEPGAIPRYRIQYQTNHPVFGGSAVLLFSGPGFLVQVDQTVIDLSVGQVFSFGLRITPDRRVTATLDGEITVDLTDLGGLPESFTIAAGFDQHGTLDDVSLVASGVFCDDGLACTDDTCQVDGSCTAPLLASTCLIGGVCYPVSMPAPDNPCGICVPETPLAWSPAAGDGSLIECETGDGCEIDGACATDSTSCQGQPLDCDDLDACTSDTCAAGLCEHDPIPGCGIDPDASDGSDGTDATDATEDIGPEAA